MQSLEARIKEVCGRVASCGDAEAEEIARERCFVHEYMEKAPGKLIVFPPLLARDHGVDEIQASRKLEIGFAGHARHSFHELMSQVVPIAKGHTDQASREQNIRPPFSNASANIDTHNISCMSPQKSRPASLELPPEEMLELKKRQLRQRWEGHWRNISRCKLLRTWHRGNSTIETTRTVLFPKTLVSRMLTQVVSLLLSSADPTSPSRFSPIDRMTRSRTSFWDLAQNAQLHR